MAFSKQVCYSPQFTDVLHNCEQNKETGVVSFTVIEISNFRHGRKHDIMPSDINYRANIYALKEEGCSHVVVTTACGSLREEFKPGDLVFPDQFIDRTHKRESTFYDGKEGSPAGICHMPMHEPYCLETREVSNLLLVSL